MPSDHRPLWYLAAGKVVPANAKGARVPANSTHWCHEGDASWTPIEPKATRPEHPKTKPEPAHAAD